MAAIEKLDTGVVYRNPKPHLYSRHAYFPWVTALPSGDLLASFQVGQAFEAADAHCELARSTDNGATWTQEGRLYEGTGPNRPTSDCFKVTADREAGIVIAFGCRMDRSDPEAAICNEETGGVLPMEVIQFLSADEGRTWSEPIAVDTIIPGPFEAQAPVVVLSDGRWLAPMSTWKAWDGSNPNGDRAIALVSSDKGQTWSELVDVMVDPAQNVIFWEMRIIEMQPGRLLAVAWAHDQAAGKDLEDQYAVSDDGGKTWSPYRSTGIPGQSCCPLYIGDNRVLLTYNYRYDEPGVRARIARIEGDEWIQETETVLWGVGAEDAGAQRQEDKVMVREMSSFKFGQPSPHKLPDGSILTVHWCVEDCIGEIRWNKMRVT